MSDHHVAAGAFLIFAVGGIGYLVSMGVSSSLQHKGAKEEKGLASGLNDAITAARQGNHKVAGKLFTDLTKDHPGNPTVWLNYGIALRAADDLEGADKKFLKVLEIDPDDYDAVAERASVQLEQGDVDKAIVLMRKIPTGKGRVVKRLTEDSLWLEFDQDPRMDQLYLKHGIKKNRLQKDNSLIREQNKKMVPENAPAPEKATPKKLAPKGAPPKPPVKTKAAVKSKKLPKGAAPSKLLKAKPKAPMLKAKPSN